MSTNVVSPAPFERYRGCQFLVIEKLTSIFCFLGCTLLKFEILTHIFLLFWMYVSQNQEVCIHFSPSMDVRFTKLRN